MRIIINKIIYFVDCIIPKKDNYFVFSSFPDMSDNSFEMFRYLYALYKNKKAKFVWLVTDMAKVAKYKHIIIDEMNLLEPDLKKIVFVEKNSIYGLLYYVRSKYIFFTHGLYPQVKFPATHIIVNLWHGMPLKRIGYLDNPNNANVPNATFSIATSSFFQNYMAKAFGMKKENVLISGQPRNDLLFEKHYCLKKFGISKEQYKKIFFWTPTYRQAIIGYEGIDGEVFKGLPVISEEYEMLNDYLKDISSYMLIKLHPMDILNKTEFKLYSNFVVLTNNDLEKYSLQLNQILSEVDVLITDFSSIYIDFLLLNKPIGYVMDDFRSFSNSRGFIIENPKEYMPGDFILSKKEYFDFLNKCVADYDDLVNKRRSVNKIFNEVKQDFSKQLWDKIIEYSK